MAIVTCSYPAITGLRAEILRKSIPDAIFQLLKNFHRDGRTGKSMIKYIGKLRYIDAKMAHKLMKGISNAARTQTMLTR